MTPLVSLARAKQHLRVDHDSEDAYIGMLIYAAGEAIVTYLKSPSFVDSAGDVLTDSAGDPVDVPYAVQAASLLLIGEWWKNREAEQQGAIDAQFGYGYLPRPVVALLYPLRDPSLS